MKLRRLSLIGVITLLCLPHLFAVPVDNGLVDTIFNQECFHNRSADVILLLDGSGSVGDNNFASQTEFAVMLSRALRVSPAGSHVGVVQFSEKPQLHFGLTDHTNLAELESALLSLPFLGGATRTGVALSFALSDAYRDARGGDIPRVLVLLTDGQSQVGSGFASLHAPTSSLEDDITEPAEALKAAGITVYAIGLSNLINVDELHEISGNPDRTFTVESLDELQTKISDAITLDICKTDFEPGEPEIVCGHDRIGVVARTRRPFDGFVFVLDHFHDEECRMSARDMQDPLSISFSVPFNQCNLLRYRSIDPPGVYVEMTAVFMFHMRFSLLLRFMTKVDHTVKVQCFYMEAEKNVTVPLSVSMLSTQLREQQYQMPTCKYTLRRDGPDGPEVEFATLGEHIYHRWECLDEYGRDTFGMLVHSCYVDNGYGDRVDVINATGCGIDKYILQTPDYESSLRVASQAYHVFKYADRPVLQFQCQITLCLKYENGCAGITPPSSCPPAEHHPHHSLHARAAASPPSPPLLDPDLTLDIFTKPITVLPHSIPSCLQESAEQRDQDREEYLQYPPLFTACNLALSCFSLAAWLWIFCRGGRRMQCRL